MHIGLSYMLICLVCPWQLWFLYQHMSCACRCMKPWIRCCTVYIGLFQVILWVVKAGLKRKLGCAKVLIISKSFISNSDIEVIHIWFFNFAKLHWSLQFFFYSKSQVWLVFGKVAMFIILVSQIKEINWNFLKEQCWVIITINWCSFHIEEAGNICRSRLKETGKRRISSLEIIFGTFTWTPFLIAMN